MQSRKLRLVIFVLAAAVLYSRESSAQGPSTEQQVAAELDLSSRIPGLDLEGPLQEVLWLVKTTREQLSSMTSPMVLEGTLENSHYQALLPSAELEWHKESAPACKRTMADGKGGIAFRITPPAVSWVQWDFAADLRHCNSEFQCTAKPWYEYAAGEDVEARPCPMCHICQDHQLVSVQLPVVDFPNTTLYMLAVPHVTVIMPALDSGVFMEEYRRGRFVVALMHQDATRALQAGLSLADNTLNAHMQAVRTYVTWLVSDLERSFLNELQRQATAALATAAMLPRSSTAEMARAADVVAQLSSAIHKAREQALQSLGRQQDAALRCLPASFWAEKRSELKRPML